MAILATIRGILPTPGNSVPTDFRADILTRLKALEKTKYWLAERLNGKVTRSAIYGYLKSKGPSEIGADKLEMMLNVLEEEERKQK